MFETLGDFSIFFWSVASLLLAGIIFEEKFLALEDRFDAWFKKKTCNLKNKKIINTTNRKGR